MAMANWSQLPEDLLCIIGNKLAVADRCGFRSVCKSWKCCIPPFAQPPWLMLSEPPQLESSSQSGSNKSEKTLNEASPVPLRGFVGMGCGGEQQQVVYNIELPEAHQRRCVGSTGNWLITVDLYKRIHLLNPFTRVQFDLPPQTTFKFRIPPCEVATPEEHRDILLRKLVVSSTASLSKSNSGSGTSKDCIVMAIHHYWKKLAIARPGDRYWASVYTPKNYFEDIIFYKEQFYAVNHHGIVMVCDIGDGQHSPRTSMLTRKLPQSMISHYHVKYLVEWCGELLMVIKNVLNLDKKKRRKEIPLYKTGTFDVYKLDFRNRDWEEVNSLGEYCLFLGSNTSVSVLPGHYSGGLQKNCIYFTDDYTYGYRGKGIPGGRDMGVFDLEDKTIRPHYRGVSTCYHSPPLWLIPTLPAK